MKKRQQPQVLDVELLRVPAKYVTWLVTTAVSVGMVCIGGVAGYLKLQYDQREELRALRRDVNIALTEQWTLAEQREFAHQLHNKGVVEVPNVDAIAHEIHPTRH